MAAGMIREKQTCKIYGENTNINLTTLPQKVQKEKKFHFPFDQKKNFSRLSRNKLFVFSFR